ncbi:MAG TPA: site-specific tyrosine recombinase XerD [Rhizomicrobium sp.]|nr:site-specific tyrosine recombinase XerD [Rhizomicrobium sp.]
MDTGRPRKTAPAKAARDTAAVLEDFLDMMSAERGASQNTLAAYRRDLLDFAGFIKGNLTGASRDEVKAYLRHLSKSGMAGSSQARRLSALRQFFRFAYSDGLRSDDPTDAVDAPRRQRPLPKVLSVDEIDALISAAREDGETPEGKRLICILEVLYASGLRVSELVTLPHAAVRNRDTIFVRGKGGKERIVPLNPHAREAIKNYLDVRAEFLPNGSRKTAAERYLFASRSAEGHLTRRRCHQMLKALALKANIDPEKLSPHVLRHAFATHLVEGGADLRSVQTLLGHADVATTQIYTHVARDRLEAMVTKAHPLARQKRTNRRS